MPQQRTGTGFIGLQQYLGANQGAVTRTGQQLTAPVEAEGQKATDESKGVADAIYQQAKAAGPGKPVDPQSFQGAQQAEDDAYAAGRDARGLNSFAGLQDALRQRLGTSSYSAGDSALDAQLEGSAYGGAFQALSQKYGGLNPSQQFQDAASRGAKDYVAPPVQPAAAPKAVPRDFERPGNVKNSPRAPVDDGFIGGRRTRNPYGGGF